MESTSCVDTSLNLCISPNSRHTDVAGDKEFVEELNRLSNENKEISEKLRRMSEKYSALKKQYLNLSMKSNNNNNNNNHDCETDIIRKRKCDESGNNKMVNLNGECCSTTTINEDYYYSFKRPKDHTHTHTTTQSPHHHNKVSKILVRTDASDPSLYVRDGYQWRKYGQKVTRDNPSPRAYFRCSHAPSCPVKKKVQRSVEDPSILVATYEGEHNHVDNINGISGSESYSSDQLIQRSGSMIDNNNINAVHTTKIQQFLVQQMASTLTRDPNFTSALANAISGRFLDNHT